MFSKKVKTILTVPLVSILAIYIYYYADDFKIILSANKLVTVAIFSINLGFILTIGHLQRTTLLAYKIKQGLSEAFFLAIVTTFGNYFLPMRGGAGMRAVYLKKKHKLNYHAFLANMLFQLILLLEVVSFVVFLIFLYDKHYLTALFSLVLCIVATLAIYKSEYFYKLLIFRKVRKVFSKFYRSWRKIKLGSNYFIKCYLAFFLFYLVNILICSLEVLALELNTHIDFELLWQGVVISTTNLLASVLVISPGGIGVREAMMGLLSAKLPFTANQLISLSLYDRAITMIQVFLLISLAYRFLKISHDSD